jgi:anti-anti-sigma factor
MQVRWSEEYRVAVIDPQGDLGIRSMVEIKNAIGSLLADGCRTVILDVRGIQRLEAMSLGVLVERLCRLREQGGTLAMANVAADILARLAELRVDSLFGLYESVPAALADLVGTQAEIATALAA